MSIHHALIDLLEKRRANYRLVEHIAEGRSAQIAKIRGNRPEQAMKAIVVMAKKSKKDRAFYLAVLPGSRQIDLDAIKAYCGAQKAIFAPLEKAKELTSCEIGAIPPFSFHSDLPLIADPLILQNNEIVFNAGLLTKSIFMNIKDYIEIARPAMFSFAKQPDADPSRLNRKDAAAK